MRFASVDQLPPGLRKLFDEQFVRTDDGKIVERSAPIKPVRSRVPEPEPEPIEIPPLVPYAAMNVGADAIALGALNKTETRFYEILKSREEYVWIGVHTMRFRLAANTHYTPDFTTLGRDGILTQWDAKGGWTFEDAQLKMKLVARMFPFFRWVKAELTLATRKKPESLKETVFPS